jgi:hypothetical protein
METDFSPKMNKKFVCKFCCISCDKPNEWKRHINTIKHKSNENGENGNKETIKHVCKCGKIYKDRSGLWKHSKNCKDDKKEINNKKELYNTDESQLNLFIKETNDFKHLILDVVKNNFDVIKQNQELQIQNQELQKQNQEFQNKILDICQTSNITNNSHNNNKTFNMQFFLNEQCKDAMNIMDFVNTFQLQFSDLENVGKLGYVDGISDIIIKKLNEMDVYKRPIHCSDAKRDTLFIKANNVWSKETGNYDKLRLAIRYITKKNTDMLNPWCESHPGSMNSENYLNDIYLNIVTQAMGGKGGIEENENKIIKKIAKTVLIEK